MSSNAKHTATAPLPMDPGNLAPAISDYATMLESLGHTQLTIAGHTDSARHFSAWIHQQGIALAKVDHAIVERFTKHICRCGGNRRCKTLSQRYISRSQRFARYLADRGVIPALTVRTAQVVEPRLLAYQHWLEHHRGLCESTIRRHINMVTRLSTVLGHDPLEYDAKRIRRAVLMQAHECSPVYVKSMVTALRGYLRFLSAVGDCQPGLEYAVPPVPQWRLASLPLYLCATDVERVIGSCNLETVHGVRDRAILLLLARLGLRAGDILNMKLRDIDWSAATVQVSGKSHRAVTLPLPQDVGEAVLMYLNGVRSCVDEEWMFLRSCAPYRKLAHPSTVSSIVSLALRRAAIENPPSRGANLLRHSAATAMLRGGATLQAVGSMLRHHSLDTTTHYAKVDLRMLQQIAQPWPGEK